MGWDFHNLANLKVILTIYYYSLKYQRERIEKLRILKAIEEGVA